MFETTPYQCKATVSTKGQVAIPRFFRDLLGVQAGSEIIFELNRQGTCVVHPVKQPLERFFGCCEAAPETGEPVLGDADLLAAIAGDDRRTRSYTRKNKDK